MISFTWNLVFFAVALGILVTVHEAGHFFAAKRCGVKILTFSIGFGPILFKRTLKDGCIFAVSLIPLGGYVKMKGEGEEASDPDSYMAQSLLKRTSIIAAGPLCNIFLAFFLYFAVGLWGVQVQKPVIADVIPGSEAELKGLKPMSLISEVNGEKVRNWADVIMELASADGKETEVKTLPFGDQGSTVSTSLKSRVMEDVQGTGLILQNLGLRPLQGKLKEGISFVKSGSPADLAGIKPGDRIIAVNAEQTPNWYRLQDAIRRGDGSSMRLLVQRDGNIYETDLVPDLVYVKSLKQNIAQIGIGAEMSPDPTLYEEVRYGPFEAASRAFDETLRMSQIVVKAVIKMLSGAVSPDNIQGPIAMAKGAGDSAAAGLGFFLSFLAAISVNLGILNLLPIPVLDGGQLVFIAYEAVFKKAPGQKTQRMLSVLGLSLLLLLMMLAVFNDIRSF